MASLADSPSRWLKHVNACRGRCRAYCTSLVGALLGVLSLHAFANSEARFLLDNERPFFWTAKTSASVKTADGKLYISLNDLELVSKEKFIRLNFCSVAISLSRASPSGPGWADTGIWSNKVSIDASLNGNGHKVVFQRSFELNIRYLANFDFDRVFLHLQIGLLNAQGRCEPSLGPDSPMLTTLLPGLGISTVASNQGPLRDQGNLDSNIPYQRIVARGALEGCKDASGRALIRIAADDQVLQWFVVESARVTNFRLSGAGYSSSEDLLEIGCGEDSCIKVRLNGVGDLLYSANSTILTCRPQDMIELQKALQALTRNAK
jgi:hypothetical protein